MQLFALQFKSLISKVCLSFYPKIKIWLLHLWPDIAFDSQKVQCRNLCTMSVLSNYWNWSFLKRNIQLGVKKIKLKTDSKWIKTDIVDHYLLFGGRLRIVIKNYLIKYWSFMHGSLRFRLFSRIANTKMHGTGHGCIAEDFCLRVIALK